MQSRFYNLAHLLVLSILVNPTAHSQSALPVKVKDRFFSTTIGGEPDWSNSGTLTTINNRRYKLGPFIDNGSQGIVFFGWDILDTRLVAIKYGEVNKPEMLAVEITFYESLQKFVASQKDLQYPKGIPKMYNWDKTAQIQYPVGGNRTTEDVCTRHPFFNREEKVLICHSSEALPIRTYWQAIVLELLETDLKNLVEKQPDKKFSLDTIKKIGRQVLETLVVVHQLGYVHSDITPDNIMSGRASQNRSNQAFLIDFSSAQKLTGAHLSIEWVDPRIDLIKLGTSLLNLLAINIGKSREDCDTQLLRIIDECRGIKDEEIKEVISHYFIAVLAFAGDFQSLINMFSVADANDDLDWNG